MQALKTLLLISSFLIWTSSYGQLDKFKGIWITPAQELMQIEDTGDLQNNNYLSNSILRNENFELYIYGDTLSFQKRYYSSATNYEKLYTDRFDLKIISLSDTSFVVSPVTSFSKKFFQNKAKLTFIKQSSAVDPTIKIEKVIFHTTECFGRCNVYHLQVDSSRFIKLHRQLVYSEIIGAPMDTTIEGYFTGQLNDTSFQKLIKAIQTCNIRTLKMNNTLCCDGSVSTIIVYFNGQRKYYKTMFPPTIANELIGTLYKICEIDGLTRISDKFKIEE